MVWYVPCVARARYAHALLLSLFSLLLDPGPREDIVILARIDCAHPESGPLRTYHTLPLTPSKHPSTIANPHFCADFGGALPMPEGLACRHTGRPA